MSKKNFDKVLNTKKYIKANETPFFINAFGAKAAILLEEGGVPMGVWLDKKTYNYQNVALRGNAVFYGGAWRGSNKDTDELEPLDVYRRSLEEEIQNRSAVMKGADFNIKNLILRNIEPFNDYFTAVPQEFIGNPNLTQKFYCDVTSVFVSVLDATDFYDALKLRTQDKNLLVAQERLKLILNERDPLIISYKSLTEDGNPIAYGFGDGHKLRDIIKQRYGDDIQINFPRITSIILKSSPNDYYYERSGIIKNYLREDNNPYKTQDGMVSARKVFEKRS